MLIGQKLPLFSQADDHFSIFNLNRCLSCLPSMFPTFTERSNCVSDYAKWTMNECWSLPGHIWCHSAWFGLSEHQMMEQEFSSSLYLEEEWCSNKMWAGWLMDWQTWASRRHLFVAIMLYSCEARSYHKKHNCFLWRTKPARFYFLF